MASIWTVRFWILRPKCWESWSGVAVGSSVGADDVKLVGEVIGPRRHDRKMTQGRNEKRNRRERKLSINGEKRRSIDERINSVAGS
jgi:hypothetical protein